MSWSSVNDWGLTREFSGGSISVVKSVDLDLISDWLEFGITTNVMTRTRAKIAPLNQNKKLYFFLKSFSLICDLINLL